MSADPTDLFVLDFDGVIVDSEPEVSTSALDCASAYFPSHFNGLDAAARQRVLFGLKKSRPVLVRGYESVVMARLLAEDPEAWRRILREWPSLLPASLAKWGETEAQLTWVFEEHRCKALDGNRDGWLACNQPYPGVKEALQGCDFPFYIATSKAAHRVAPLMAVNLGLDIPQDSPRLFASLLPPNERKAAVLRDIGGRPLAAQPATALHFVDDRFETLQAIRAAGDLSRWRLYLADWGYATAEEIEEARETPGVTVLSLNGFLEMLRWGLSMGVDDGCEPTEEEVRASVA